MKLSERIRNLRHHFAVDDVAQTIISDVANEVAQLEAEDRQLRRIIEVNAPDVDVEYNLSKLALLTFAISFADRAYKWHDYPPGEEGE